MDDPLSPEDRRAFAADPCLPGMWVVLGYPEAAACMRDGRLHRQEHFDKLFARFGAERIYQRQKLDIPHMDGDAHALARQHMLVSYPPSICRS